MKNNPYRDLQQNAERLLEQNPYPGYSALGKAELVQKIANYRAAADRYDEQLACNPRKET